MWGVRAGEDQRSIPCREEPHYPGGTEGSGSRAVRPSSGSDLGYGVCLRAPGILPSSGAALRLQDLPPFPRARSVPLGPPRAEDRLGAPGSWRGESSAAPPPRLGSAILSPHLLGREGGGSGLTAERGGTALPVSLGGCPRWEERSEARAGFCFCSARSSRAAGRPGWAEAEGGAVAAAPGAPPKWPWETLAAGRSGVASPGPAARRGSLRPAEPGCGPGRARCHAPLRHSRERIAIPGAAPGLRLLSSQTAWALGIDWAGWQSRGSQGPALGKVACDQQPQDQK